MAHIRWRVRDIKSVVLESEIHTITGHSVPEIQAKLYVSYLPSIRTVIAWYSSSHLAGLYITQSALRDVDVSESPH